MPKNNAARWVLLVVFYLDNFSKREVKTMTLNILFLTITIKRRKQSREEANHQEMVNQLYEKHKDRQISNIL
jgi:uncharacterized protein (TIGR02413 family)